MCKLVHLNHVFILEGTSHDISRDIFLFIKTPQVSLVSQDSKPDSYKYFPLYFIFIPQLYFILEVQVVEPVVHNAGDLVMLELLLLPVSNQQVSHILLCLGKILAHNSGNTLHINTIIQSKIRLLVSGD